jgi:hypothetical protein
MAYLTGKSALEIDQAPSLAWINQALVSGHAHLLRSLETLNDMLGLTRGSLTPGARRNINHIAAT